MRISALVTALTVLATSALTAQVAEKPPSFTAEATMVRLSVAVTTKLKAPLAAADFTVYDNGQKQDISFFDTQSLPMDISLFVDTSGSLSVREKDTGLVHLLDGVAQSAKRFVNILKPGDRMEVIDFADRIVPLQDLTEDKEMLLLAIDRLSAGGQRTLLSRALYLKFDELRRMAGDPAQPRRKVLVFITDAIDTGNDISEDTLRNKARQAEASVYMLALQPTVLNQTAADESAAAQSRWLMQQLCKETGGAFLPALTPYDISNLAKKISAEIAAEHTVGWAPATPDSKDPWHTIQVAVRNVPGERLRYRNGYLAAKR